MARNYFAIERPRRISISIQGYDAQAVTQAQQKKRLERNKRQNRKAATTPPATPDGALPSPAVSIAAAVPDARPRQDEDEIEALGKAAAGATPHACDADLKRAFAGSGLAEAGAHHANE